MSSEEQPASVNEDGLEGDDGTAPGVFVVPEPDGVDTVASP